MTILGVVWWLWAAVCLGGPTVLAFALAGLDRHHNRRRDTAYDNVWVGIEARRTACTVNATKHRSGR